MCMSCSQCGRLIPSFQACFTLLQSAYSCYSGCNGALKVHFLCFPEWGKPHSGGSVVPRGTKTPWAICNKRCRASGRLNVIRMEFCAALGPRFMTA